jgi:hypothetical protein
MAIPPERLEAAKPYLARFALNTLRLKDTGTMADMERAVAQPGSVDIGVLRAQREHLKAGLDLYQALLDDLDQVIKLLGG